MHIISNGQDAYLNWMTITTTTTKKKKLKKEEKEEKTMDRKFKLSVTFCFKIFIWTENVVRFYLPHLVVVPSKTKKSFETRGLESSALKFCSTLTLVWITHDAIDVGYVKTLSRVAFIHFDYYTDDNSHIQIPHTHTHIYILSYTSSSE